MEAPEAARASKHRGGLEFNVKGKVTITLTTADGPLAQSRSFFNIDYMIAKEPWTKLDKIYRTLNTH